MADEKVLRSRPVLFLDIDDTVCLHRPYGGYDVLEALMAESRGLSLMDSHQDLWTQLFASAAVNHLALLHEEFSPMYVLSTSWARLMDAPTLRRVLTLSGLGFVAASLHDDSSTPARRGVHTRWEEISDWLNAHPELGERWVVLDDELSGTGLQDQVPAWLRPFIVICEAQSGLSQGDYLKLRLALSARTLRRSTSHSDRQDSD